MKKLRASWKLNKPDLFGPDVSLGEDVIHVLVLVPGQGLSVGAAALREPHPVRKKSKRVCIVEAKRDDFQQGLAQAYVGCEVLADVEGLTKLYSIVTNFKEWYFSRSLDDRIERFDATITIVNDIPTRESVKMIAEKIYSMLSDDEEPAVASNEAIL
ncbi:hypothetical protein JG687_00005951 [Phytophthora cactorum]|uniref:Uncharacterized protein n=1 Tax=Phytophthora cactorum TaxID=29920 RepID=A0A8T1UMF0_9STRA|nr:hypothetical protein JG687_00005951 [Phytophthora cactorum]